MSRRRKRRKAEGAVELNMAAMLDMAFQLLAFFVLTFRPSPIEGQISLRMPPAQSITPLANAVQAGSDTSNTDPVQGLNSLVISVIPDAGGGIASLAIGEGVVATLSGLNDRLKAIFGDQASPFDQVVVQVGSGLRYDALMSVVDVCTRQRLRGGEKLTKLSFVELPEATAE